MLYGHSSHVPINVVSWVTNYEQYKVTSLIFFLLILCNEPTNAQLIDNILYCSYMFRQYCVIFRELVVSTC